MILTWVVIYCQDSIKPWTDLLNIYAALEAMQECGVPLLVHGEVTDTDIDIDIFDREAVFIERRPN